MRRIGLMIAFAVSLAACSGGSTDTPPGTTNPSPSIGSPSPELQTANVGDSLTLRGTEDGALIDVTVSELIDPYTLQSDVLVPEEGTRLVAFELELTNSGTVAYSDSPSNGAVLFDVDNVEWNSVVTGEDAALVSVTLAPGDSDSGLIYFQLPEDLDIERLQLTLNSGYGPETGEWALG